MKLAITNPALNTITPKFTINILVSYPIDKVLLVDENVVIMKAEATIDRK